MVTPGRTSAWYPSQTSLPIMMSSPRLDALMTRSIVRSDHSNPNIVVGEYSYYDDPDDPTAFERDAVLYAYGPERLVIGRY